MIFPLTVAAVFTAATLVIAVLVAGVLFVLRKPQRRFWRTVGWLHATLFLVHLFVTFPLALGWFGSRGIGTRHDERAYEGPRIDGGRLLVQDRASMRTWIEGQGPAVDLAIAAAARARARAVPSTDGVTVQAFQIEVAAEPPRAVAVLVHGLFRSAFELESVAAMLREQDVECWLCELRNFGGSTRAPFSAGWRESDDVVATVARVRSEPQRAALPLYLFGVSLGTAAVAFALPRIDGVAGVVLDAPIDDIPAAAHRMLGFDRGGDRRSFFRIDEPWQSLVLASLEAWSNVDLDPLCPADVLATLPIDLPVLVIAAERDDRAPPATVRRLFERLPMPASRKRYWQVAGSGHGQVFLDRPAEYAEHLRWLLAQPRR
jgi:alpha-beta hydrolase superfamily lysophospholipase